MTYVYRRKDGTTFEYQQSIKDAPLTVCPKTGQTVSRLIGSANVVFRGTGWARDGYSRSKRIPT